MMKRLMRWLSCLSLIVISICLGLSIWVQPVAAANMGIPSVTLLAAKTELPNASDIPICPEFDQKIDLNNANMAAFKDCQGFYPGLASLIIKNGPYQKIEDVLEIPGLSDRQKALLKSQLKNFTVTEPVMPMEIRMPPRSAIR